MGDRRRHDVLSKFILGRYPPNRFPRVADVAGGQGYLSLALADLGYSPVVLDPRTTNLSKKQRRAMMRGLHRPFQRYFRMLDESDLDRFDLFVGLHPDGATEALARLGARGHPVVIVPCCNYWRGPESHGSKDVAEMIERTWKAARVTYRDEDLPIVGKNRVLRTG